MSNIVFSQQELSRYHRHLILPGFGQAAQEKLKSSKILVVGAGGLGCPALLYLAAAGVGTLGIIDFDRVEESNLQRQVLFTTQDIGRFKTEAAQEKLQALNPFIQVKVHTIAVSTKNVFDLLAQYEVIIDGSDNFPTRYLLNDACIFSQKTYVYGAISRFEGQVSVFNQLSREGDRGPNYRDLYPTPPPPGLVPSCADGGVLGILPGIIGTMQAAEAIKIVSGIGQSLSGRLWMFDVLATESRTISIKKRSTNPVTGIHPTITHLIDYEAYCDTNLRTNSLGEISPTELKKWVESGKMFQIIDVREGYEYEKRNLAGELIPLGVILEQVSKISRILPVVVHCQSGSRSMEAIRRLQNLGFSNLYNLTGGIESYDREHGIKS